MKTLLWIMLITSTYFAYSYHSKYHQLLSNSEIDFYISYEIEEIVDCSPLDCHVKVNRESETIPLVHIVETLKPKLLERNSLVVRECTGNLKNRTVTCMKNLKPFDDINPKFVRYPDWDLRPAADEVIYN